MPHVPEVYPIIEGPVYVRMELLLPLFKTVVRDLPKGDVDNYAKSVLDLLTSSERVWTDDIQVNHLEIFKRFVRDDEEPACHVFIREGTPL